MKNLIEKIKAIMTDVATGLARIQDKNDEYKEMYQELDNLFQENGLKNPNSFSDLWEFYNYWKKKLKTYAERRDYIIKIYKSIEPKKVILKKGNYNYVNLERISELKSIKAKTFDMTKLVKLCEELNIAFSNKCFLSVGMIIRAIIDHIPPIFNKFSFGEVTNNHGTKSFKESMKNLDSSSRKISDSYLHSQVRRKESLPNSNQVDFSNDLDVLLGEICRLLN